MDRLYCSCRVRLNGAETFAIWYEDERDGFVRDSGGQLITAESLPSLWSMAAGLGLVLVPERASEYDFDQLRTWCREPTSKGVDCQAFLNAWNFFDDLAGIHDHPGSEYAQLSRGAGQCYDKLFWGNNLPSVTPSGERFVPDWDAEEIDRIRQVMEAGLDLIGVELQRGGVHE